MGLLILGVDHCSAPAAIREGLAFDEGCRNRGLHALQASFPDTEFVLLSTCNRVEIYAAGDPAPPEVDELVRFLARFHGMPSEKMAGHLVVHHGEAAVDHLFRVATGLESLVPGESQVLGQVRDAYGAATACAAAGPILHIVFQRALRAGKRARQQTGLGRCELSVPSVAVALARQVCDRLGDKTVLVIGAGRMAELTVQHLVADRPGAILVANRDFDRACALAARFGGRACAFDRLDGALIEADVVISTTAAPEPIVDQNRFAVIQRARRDRPVLIIDIAVPRDFDPCIRDLDQVSLYNIDDLRRQAEQSPLGRSAQLEDAEVIVEREATACSSAMRHHRHVAVLLRQLGDRADAVLDRELDRLFAAQPDLREGQRAAIVQAMSRLRNQLLHHPRTALRRAVDAEDSLDSSLLFEAARLVLGFADTRPDENAVTARQNVGCPVRISQ